MSIGSDRYAPRLVAACPVIARGEHHTTIATRVSLDEMVERAARAVARNVDPDVDWDDLSHEFREAHLGDARVALTAALGQERES